MRGDTGKLGCRTVNYMDSSNLVILWRFVEIWFLRQESSKTGYFKEQLVKNSEDCGEGFYVCDYSRLVVDLGELVKIRGRERIQEVKLLGSSRFVDADEFGTKRVATKEESKSDVSFGEEAFKLGARVARCRSGRGCVPSREAARPARHVVRYLK